MTTSEAVRLACVSIATMVVAAPVHAQDASSARPDATATAPRAVAPSASPAPSSAPPPALSVEQLFTREEATLWQRYGRAPYRGVVPHGTRIAMLPNAGLLTAGIAAAFVAIVGSTLAAVALHDGTIAIPVGGPFYGTSQEFNAVSACSGVLPELCQCGHVLGALLFIVDGAAQVASGALITAGFVRRRPWLVPDGADRRLSGRMRWAVILGTPDGLGGVTAISTL